MAYSCCLLNSLGCCLSAVLRDAFFSTRRAKAVDDVGLSFGGGLILGLAVGGLWPRFKPKRVSIPQTELRLYPRRRAICAALCPAAHSLLSNATSFASQPMRDYSADWPTPASLVFIRLAYDCRFVGFILLFVVPLVLPVFIRISGRHRGVHSYERRRGGCCDEKCFEIVLPHVVITPRKACTVECSRRTASGCPQGAIAPTRRRPVRQQRQGAAPNTTGGVYEYFVPEDTSGSISTKTSPAVISGSPRSRSCRLA